MPKSPLAFRALVKLETKSEVSEAKVMNFLKQMTRETGKSWCRS
jgi:hypothetical protein